MSTKFDIDAKVIITITMDILTVVLTIVHRPSCHSLRFCLKFSVFCSNDRLWTGGKNQSCRPLLSLNSLHPYHTDIMEENWKKVERKKTNIVMMKHKWITCLARHQPAFNIACPHFNNICQSCQLNSTKHLYGKTQRWENQKSALRVISTNELTSRIWKMPASDSPLLFVVRWIYSYNPIVRGLWVLLTVAPYYSVVIYITHWI